MALRPPAGSYARSDEFSKNAENLAAILKVSTQLDRLHKTALRRRSQPEIAAMAETQYLYLGIEAEARLRKIVSDPTGFDLTDRQKIRSCKSQIDRWLKAVDLSFGDHYNAMVKNRFAADVLPDTVRQRHTIIREMLDKELRPVIENRNKIAHGQPRWQLKSQSDFDFKSSSAPLEYGDYWDLKHRRLMLSAIGDVVLTLVVSMPTFERDFQKYNAAFDAARSNILANCDGSQYQAFTETLTQPKFLHSGKSNP